MDVRYEILTLTLTLTLIGLHWAGMRYANLTLTLTLSGVCEVTVGFEPDNEFSTCYCI